VRDDVRGKDDQVAGDVRHEQTAQPEEADHVRASRRCAEQCRKEGQPNRAVD
jgi:hypothetical protein